MGSKQTESVRRGCSRREALTLMLGAGIGMATGRLGAEPAGDDLILRTIPHGGERIPVVGLGSSDTFEVGASDAQRAPVREVLKRYVELGGSVVDTSPMYGTAETVIGDVAHQLGISAKLWLATKVWTGGREAGIEQMEQSFRRLRTDSIDLMQVHNLVDTQTHLRTLRGWKEQGRVRYIGVTHYQVSAYEELARLIRDESLDFVQFNYSIATREAERMLLPLAAEQHTAVMINRAYEDGGLFAHVRGKPLPGWAAEFDCVSWGQFFLKYVISHPAVTSVIPATSKVNHLVDNMGAGRGRLPDAAMRTRMVAYFESL
ncbi:MAG: aldo/keto reductase [Gammaproteobacteria bacterium]|nr:MAG: aldo/keto reductase [Gammaproteobacteria bacterium]